MPAGAAAVASVPATESVPCALACPGTGSSPQPVGGARPAAPVFPAASDMCVEGMLGIPAGSTPTPLSPDVARGPSVPPPSPKRLMCPASKGWPLIGGLPTLGLPLLSGSLSAVEGRLSGCRWRLAKASPGWACGGARPRVPAVPGPPPNRGPPLPPGEGHLSWGSGFAVGQQTGKYIRMPLQVLSVRRHGTKLGTRFVKQHRLGAPPGLHLRPTSVQTHAIQ